MANRIFDSILFWIAITLTIIVALWLLHGSPTETGSIIAVALFTATSEVLIWRYMFNLDKNVSISFIKMKNEMNTSFIRIESEWIEDFQVLMIN